MLLSRQKMHIFMILQDLRIFALPIIMIIMIIVTIFTLNEVKPLHIANPEDSSHKKFPRRLADDQLLDVAMETVHAAMATVTALGNGFVSQAQPVRRLSRLPVKGPVRDDPRSAKLRLRPLRCDWLAGFRGDGHARACVFCGGGCSRVT